MGPVITIHNRTDKRIKFLMEVDGKVVSLGVCKIRSVEAGNIGEASQREILRSCHRHETLWKIRVLIDDICSGLVILPIHLLNYTVIVFTYETVDDGSIVLKAKGLKKTQLKSSRFLPMLRHSFGLGSKRHREYRVLEEMYRLEDIGEAQVKDEAMRSEMGHYSLEYQQPFQDSGIKGAHLSTADVNQEIKRWENAIVGYLATEDMQGYDVKQFIDEQWKHFGSFEIYDLKPHFFLFNFTNQDDRRKALEHGQWFVYSRPLILKRWTSNLVIEPNCFVATLPVWVRFPHLNLEFWSSDSIAKISSVIGKPLFTDELTALKKRLQYARVCIEVNPMEELPKVVPIWCDVHNIAFNQSVVYEWTPQLCTYCRSLLHDSSSCIMSPNVPCLLTADSCELWDEANVSILPALDGIQDAATKYDTGSEVNALTDEADAPTDINIGISTSCSNIIQESRDINSQEPTNIELQRVTTMELLDDGRNYSATARLLGSGRSASKRFLAYSKQKAMSFVGTTNTWIESIC